MRRLHSRLSIRPTQSLSCRVRHARLDLVRQIEWQTAPHCRQPVPNGGCRRSHHASFGELLFQFLPELRCCLMQRRVPAQCHGLVELDSQHSDFVINSLGQPHYWVGGLPVSSYGSSFGHVVSVRASIRYCFLSRRLVLGLLGAGDRRNASFESSLGDIWGSTLRAPHYCMPSRMPDPPLSAATSVFTSSLWR